MITDKLKREAVQLAKQPHSKASGMTQDLRPGDSDDGDDKWGGPHPMRGTQGVFLNKACTTEMARAAKVAHMLTWTLAAKRGWELLDLQFALTLNRQYPASGSWLGSPY